jgi:8-oxo-dGTP diphosphatase
MKHYNISAAIIIVDKQILCLQRGESKYEYISQKYEFPGGKIEEGEKPENAVIREIQEELNLDIHDLLYFSTVDHVYPDFKITMHAFLCKVKDFKKINLSEHLAYQLLDPTELLNLDWAAADIPFVDKLINEFNG